MNTLLEKFNEITIENNSRLSEEDKSYCEKQQSLYEKMLGHYNKMFLKVIELNKEDKEFYTSIDETEKIYFYSFVDMDKEIFTRVIKETHNKFVIQIISYFRNRYNVNIDDKQFNNYLQIEEPVERSEYYGFCGLSDEEIDRLREAKEIYKIKYDLYLDKVISSVVKYDLIVDDIFEFLGGFSFDEKVEQEIKDASIKGSVNQYRNTKEYEIKNGKISFNGCTSSYKDSIWNRYEISLNSNDYLAILRALSFFDSNKMETDIYYNWKNKFTSYRYSKKTEEDGIYAKHDTYCSTVISFKYLKNGKWEVWFDSHVNALKFAKEFLGYSE